MAMQETRKRTHKTLLSIPPVDASPAGETKRKPHARRQASLRPAAKKAPAKRKGAMTVRPSIVPPPARRRTGGLGPETVSQLLNSYTPLVRQIAGGFQRRLPRNVLREDLIAAGMSGLWDAIRRQADRPSDSFEWYVRVRIRGAILDELRAQDWLPRRARAAAAEAQGEGKPYRVYAPAVVRFDDVSEWEQGRCLSTGDSANSEMAIDAKNTKASLARAVEKLPARERHIVSAHYFRGVKFKDLGVELGVSEPRISQLHSRAMQRLRGLMDDAA